MVWGNCKKGGSGSGRGGQGGCEPRTELIVNMKNKSGGGGGGGQGGCEPRIELIVKMKKKVGKVSGRGRGEVRVVVNEELKLL